VPPPRAGGAPTEALLRAELSRTLEGLQGASAALAGSATRVERAAGAAADAQASALADVQASLRELLKRAAGAGAEKEKELQAALAERAFMSGAMARVEAERDRTRGEAEGAAKRTARLERELAEANAVASEARAEAQRLRVERSGLLCDIKSLEGARGALQGELADAQARLDQAAVAVGGGGGKKK
jgi:chromosome segregation ATPase